MANGCAVIVVDMLNDFVTGSLMSERASAIIPKIKTLVETARKNGTHVFYLNDSHIKGRDRELELWGDHAIEGTNGAEVIDELKPESEYEIIRKRTYSGFFETGFDRKLRENGINTLIFTGIHAHICVQLNVCDAYLRGYDIVIVEDAINAFTEDDYRKGMDYMKSMFGAKAMKTEEAMKLLSQ